jgi:uncharacterized coiled-coil protein SlyX
MNGERKDRLTELEIGLTHVQRMYEHLNEVVTAQSLANQRMEQRITKLQEQIKQLKEKPQPAADPLDEKPPHY